MKNTKKIFSSAVKITTTVYKVIREVAIVYLIVQALLMLPMFKFNERLAFVLNHQFLQQLETSDETEPINPNDFISN